MTTTINASTTAGLINTADTSGVLALQTAGTTAVSISASQVVTLTNALPVASGGSGGTTSTGSGAVVLATSPVLTTPALGTPSALVLTNATGLPQAGLGTNVAGNGPAFGAYQSTAQALSANVSTKILFQTEEFDTNSNFASSTFTPTVAGYYQLNARFRVSSSLANQNIYIYKNGSFFKNGVAVDTTAVGMQINCLVYANGTTDYFEIYGLFNNSQNTTGNQAETWFNGYLARSA